MNVPYDKQGEDGKFEPTYDPDDFVAAVEALDLPTTSDVADYVECPHRTALHHLNQLEDAGRLVSRKVGPAKVWRVSEERPTGEPAAPDTGQETPREDAGERDLSALIDAVADDVLPGSGRKLEDRREALHAAVECLQERGEATPADFRADVYPDYPAHYTDADDPARSWWKNCIYKGLAELADRTDKIERADTSGEWTYWGDADE